MKLVTFIMFGLNAFK